MRKIPSESVIYMSFRYGTDDERIKRTILSTNEIKLRIKFRLEEDQGNLELNKPEIKSLYEEFRNDILKEYWRKTWL